MFRLDWLKQKIKAQEVTENISKVSEELEVEGVKWGVQVVLGGLEGRGRGRASFRHDL